MTVVANCLRLIRFGLLSKVSYKPSEIDFDIELIYVSFNPILVAFGVEVILKNFYVSFTSHILSS